jgi:hypothetical protein
LKGSIQVPEKPEKLFRNRPELTCETHVIAAEKVPPLLLGQRVGAPQWQLHTLVHTLPHPAAAAAAAAIAVAVGENERGGGAAEAQLPRNMTGCERVVACYHGHLERKTIFFKVGNAAKAHKTIFKVWNAAKAQDDDILGQKTWQQRRLAIVWEWKHCKRAIAATWQVVNALSPIFTAT